MSGSNGKSADHPPDISPEVQRLLDLGRERERVDDVIAERIGDVIAQLRAEHPDHDDRIIRKLEGAADKIRGEHEARKRKERAGGNQSGR